MQHTCLQTETDFVACSNGSFAQTCHSQPYGLQCIDELDGEDLAVCLFTD